MSGHKNVIELDGKLYDSATGKVVGVSESVHHTRYSRTAHNPVVIQPQTNGTVMDGFLTKPKHHHAQTHNPVLKPAAPIATLKAETKPTPKPKVARSAVKPVAHHTPSRAKTLMRRGLKKPATHVSQPAEETHTHTRSTHKPERLERARIVSKSSKISRFGSIVSQPHTFIKKSAPLHVKPAPDHHDRHTAHQPKTVSHHDEPPIPTHNQILKEHLVSQAIKDARVEEPHRKPVKKHRVSKKLGVSPKVFHFGAGALAAVLLFGFIAYQNAPNISMRVASTRAGFDAEIPGYKPAGFGLSGPIEYGPGQITLNFKSNSDTRNFHVTQKVSNWNSDALLSNFVTANNKSYQTYQDKGKTIYIYDGSNATWVSGGVWYQIEGNSSLSSDQLIRLASSI